MRLVALDSLDVRVRCERRLSFCFCFLLFVEKPRPKALCVCPTGGGARVARVLPLLRARRPVSPRSRVSHRSLFHQRKLSATETRIVACPLFAAAAKNTSLSVCLGISRFDSLRKGRETELELAQRLAALVLDLNEVRVSASLYGFCVGARTREARFWCEFKTTRRPSSNSDTRSRSAPPSRERDAFVSPKQPRFLQNNTTGNTT